IEFERNDIRRLNLTLVDSRLVLKYDFHPHHHKNVAVVITGLVIKNQKGIISFNLTPSTSLFFNPPIDELHNLPARVNAVYGDFICQVPHEVEYQYE
ncbi:hypothetical protein AG4045_027907, partial [Apium graveolens]